MEKRGRLVILVIFAVALAMSGYAWWHQFRTGRRSAAFWGRAAAVLVRYAPEVHFIPLAPRTDHEASRESIVIHDREYSCGSPVNVANSRGMVHARHALVDDLSFEWDVKPTESNDWEFLLQFQDDNQQATAALDTEKGVVFFVEESRTVQLIPQIATAFRQKRDEWRKLWEIQAGSKP